MENRQKESEDFVVSAEKRPCGTCMVCDKDCKVFKPDSVVGETEEAREEWRESMAMGDWEL